MNNEKKSVGSRENTPAGDKDEAQKAWEQRQKEKEAQRQKEKDAKLAEALRANLRKRKVQKKQWDQDKKDDGPDGEKS